MKYTSSDIAHNLEACETLCKKLGEAPTNVGLAWLLHNPAVTTRPNSHPYTSSHIQAQSGRLTSPTKPAALMRYFCPYSKIHPVTGNNR